MQNQTATVSQAVIDTRVQAGIRTFCFRKVSRSAWNARYRSAQERNIVVLSSAGFELYAIIEAKGPEEVLQYWRWYTCSVSVSWLNSEADSMGEVCHIVSWLNIEAGSMGDLCPCEGWQTIQKDKLINRLSTVVASLTQFPAFLSKIMTTEKFPPPWAFVMSCVDDGKRVALDWHS